MNKKYLLITLSFLALLFFASLYIYQSKKDKSKAGKDNWMNEIAIAQECGMDGMTCCADREPACNDGVCCVDPNDPLRNMCNESCECGKLNSFCCENSQCGEGLSCSGGMCVECGDKGESCCAGKTACKEGSLACHLEKCVECGFPDSPCCNSDKKCNEENNTDKARTECSGGLCVYCGSNERMACASAPFCLTGHLLSNGNCLLCGEVNQPCCNRDESGKGYECNPEKKLRCLMGFCTE